ncbi:STAS domain-containing protein [Streptomyces gardneri]|uniref:STAS domain-containing protein n=1 Tax=Nocardia TaxID=1817 RepID=UPI001356C2FD|nr:MULTISPECIES: STAS domain-containing protein [Nocardia]MBF6163441.1 STAS domain-containing protein [Streptomyces gardneri]MBF6202587.1 STAS domain-containing protein [Streptomyces gardneri]UAK35141.1 STAS domain-containing protein [Nocardia asteroides]
MFRDTERTGPLRFSVCRPRPDVTMLMVAGEIDVATAPRLRAQLASGPARRAAVLVLDLSPVTFLAAAGLSVLVEAQAEVTRTRRRMALITRVRPVDRVIEVTGLADRFHRVRSLEAALAPGYDETA